MEVSNALLRGVKRRDELQLKVVRRKGLVESRFGSVEPSPLTCHRQVRL